MKLQLADIEMPTQGSNCLTVRNLLICAFLFCNVADANVCIDTDGDGWGWDGASSCRITTTTCIDSDGDGWGWDGVASCRVGAIAETACIDEDGDGWGWNGIESCIPGVKENVLPVRITLGHNANGQNANELNSDAYEAREYGSQSPIVSGDSRFILFDTFANNVVANDTNAKSDVFLRDNVTGEVSKISQGVNGEQANNHSTAEAVSTSGGYIVYSSYSTNLVENNTRGGSQLYLFNANTGNTKLISLRTDESGVLRNSRNAMISSGGGDVVYESSTGLVKDGTDLLYYVVSSGETVSILPEVRGRAELHDFASGAVLYFHSSDQRSYEGYFYIYNMRTQTTEQLPLQADLWDYAKLSASGQYVIFTIDKKVYILDRYDAAGQPIEIREAISADITSNGRWMVYSKSGANPDAGFEPAGTLNIFVQDLLSGNSYLLTKGLANMGLNDFALFPSFTSFDNAIYFNTRASNLIEGDSNGTFDVYMYEFEAY